MLFGNPGTVPAEVSVVYQLPDGTTLTKAYDVPAESRLTVLVDKEDAQLAATALAMTVTSSQPIVAERSMWWGPDAASWYEAHASLGATETGTVWAIGEGVSGGPEAEDTYVLVSNDSADVGNVRLTAVYDEGTTEQQEVSLASRARVTLLMRELFPGTEDRRFSILVESLGQGTVAGVPITVECARYQSRVVFGKAGGAALATKIQ